MTDELETLVFPAYAFATSPSSPRACPPGLITDPELIALAAAQAVIGRRSDRQFLGVVRRLPPGWFAHLHHQAQYNRRLRRLTPHITTVQLMAADQLRQLPRPRQQERWRVPIPAVCSSPTAASGASSITT